MSPLQKCDWTRACAGRGLARSVMEDNLSQLEREETITVQPDTPVSEVMRKMKNARSGCALVLDGNKLVGIFTEHDVLHGMFGGLARQPDIAVKEFLSRSPDTLREPESV